jgi:hypothetical protein
MKIYIFGVEMHILEAKIGIFRSRLHVSETKLFVLDFRTSFLKC